MNGWDHSLKIGVMGKYLDKCELIWIWGSQVINLKLALPLASRQYLINFLQNDM